MIAPLAWTLGPVVLMVAAGFLATRKTRREQANHAALPAWMCERERCADHPPLELIERNGQLVRA